MISIEKIKKEFEQLTDSDNTIVYSGIWKFEKLNQVAELFFMSKNGDLFSIQIDNFNYLVQNSDAIIRQAENFISDYLKRKKHKNYKEFLKGKFEIDIITVFGEKMKSILK